MGVVHGTNLDLSRRAGRFGTKGLAITFVSSESDQQVMAAIQSRFEVAVPELPDHIDPASYSECRTAYLDWMVADVLPSDLLSSCLSCFAVCLVARVEYAFHESVTVRFSSLRSPLKWILV